MYTEEQNVVKSAIFIYQAEILHHVDGSATDILFFFCENREILNKMTICKIIFRFQT